MFLDDMESYEERERIVPLQERLVEVARTIRDYYNREYSMVIKGDAPHRVLQRGRMMVDGKAARYGI